MCGILVSDSGLDRDAVPLLRGAPSSLQWVDPLDIFPEPGAPFLACVAETGAPRSEAPWPSG